MRLESATMAGFALAVLLLFTSVRAETAALSATPDVCYDGYQGEQQAIADKLSTAGRKREAARIAVRLGDLSLACYAAGLAGRETLGDAYSFAVMNYGVATDLYTALGDVAAVRKYAHLTIRNAMAMRREDNPSQYDFARDQVRMVRQDAASLHVQL